MRKLDPDTLLYICETLYAEGLGDAEHRKGGATLVYDLVNSLIDSGYNLEWSYCTPCDTETPHLPDQDECLVCGSVYEEEEYDG